MPPEQPKFNPRIEDEDEEVVRWKPEGGAVFNPERAKEQVIGALDLAIGAIGKEMNRLEGLDLKKVRAIDTNTLNRFIQELTVARTFIEQGNYRGVLDDPQLLKRIQHDLKGSDVRALKRLAGRM